MAKADLARVAENLDYYVNLLTGLRESVTIALGLDNNTEDLKAQIPQLTAERDKLVDQKAQLEKDIVDSQHAHGELMRKQIEVATKDQAELNAKTHMMQSKLSMLEETHKRRMAEAEVEYKGRLDALNKEVAESQKRLDLITGRIEAAKAAMAKL